MRTSDLTENHFVCLRVHQRTTFRKILSDLPHGNAYLRRHKKEERTLWVSYGFSQRFLHRKKQTFLRWKRQATDRFVLFIVTQNKRPRA